MEPIHITYALAFLNIAQFVTYTISIQILLNKLMSRTFGEYIQAKEYDTLINKQTQSSGNPTEFNEIPEELRALQQGF